MTPIFSGAILGALSALAFIAGATLVFWLLAKVIDRLLRGLSDSPGGVE